MDSDYEDDDEEDMLDDTDANSAMLSTYHPFIIECQALNRELTESVNLLVVQELPSIFNNIQNNLASAFDSVDNFKERSLTKASIKDDVVIPTVPSAFTSEEGELFWESVLSPVDVPSGGKKAPAGKAPKGGVSDEQKKHYYASMYELLSEALFDAISRGLAEVDSHLYRLHEVKLKESRMDDLHQIASIRPADVGTDKWSHVFIKVDGAPFVSKSKLSAFDPSEMCRREVFSPIVKSAMCGADKIILIYEDKENKSDPNILQTATNVLDTLLTKELNRLPKSQQKLFCFQVCFCRTLADLKCALSKPHLSIVTEDGRRIVNVFFLNNLAGDDITPARKPFAIEDSDDECDAIPVGVEEWEKKLLHDWLQREPETVEVGVDTGVGVLSSVSVVADTAIELNKLVSAVKGVWIEGDINSVCPHEKDVYGRCHRKEAVVSDRVREMSLWLHAMSNFQSYSSLIAANGADINHDLLPRNIFGIMPSQSVVQPKFLVTIGGKVRFEKFKAIESLLDMV